MAKKAKKLYRSEKNKIIAGVCAGLADYFDMDPTLVRVIAILLFFLGFTSSLWAYLILWIVIPTKSELKKK